MTKNALRSFNRREPAAASAGVALRQLLSRFVVGPCRNL